MNATRTLDFAAYAERVATMSELAIQFALADIAKTLPLADALDIECGTDNGGYYRDQSSVLRAELTKRAAATLATV